MNAIVQIFEIEPRNVTLAELEAGECRYAYGDSDFTFCGHKVQPGSSYCRPHHMLCWTPARERVR